MKTACSILLAAALCACEHQSAAAPATKPAEASKATPEDARAFVAKVNLDLLRLIPEGATADWIKSTYITDDTERNSAAANERLFAYGSEAAKTATRFKGLALDPDTERMLYLIRVGSPVIDDPKERLELTTTGARMEGFYGRAKDKQGRDLGELEKLIDQSRDYATLLDAWTSWHDTARPQRALYPRFVELQNEGARGAGFANMGDMWRAGYDMPPESFEKETDRLWQQVKPLYDDLHCYVRGKLQKQYGKDKVPDGKPIPAHLLGNMWAQEWTNIYPLVEPYQNAANLDVEGALAAQKWEPIRVVKTAEAFFVSLGLDPLPDTFWTRSQFVKPAGREVVCHASAWDVQYNNDLRVKVCITTPPREEDLETLHHELGHDYYFHAYYQLPILFQGGANDGFHEAIGDSLVLSMTPGYLRQLGLIPKVANRRAAQGCPRQGRVPPFRQSHRPMALGCLLGKGGAGRLQQVVVGAAREVPRNRAGRRSRRVGLRSGREISCRRQCSLYALLPRADFAVPILPLDVPGRRPPGALARMQLLRQQGGGREAVEDALARRLQTLARCTRGHDRLAADGRRRAGRILRALAGLAQRAEQRTDLWLVSAFRKPSSTSSATRPASGSASME